ncbi:MAG: hypothetical protein FWH26_00965 [Oscillospiraceae bacterium]|nr:hypothetical protein [Oscillospiraceae bacterium]
MNREDDLDFRGFREDMAAFREGFRKEMTGGAFHGVEAEVQEKVKREKRNTGFRESRVDLHRELREKEADAAFRGGIVEEHEDSDNG